MTGQTFYFLAVFEVLTSIEVPQPQYPDAYDPPPPVVQAIAQRWTRSGVVQVSPMQTTEDTVKRIVSDCKESGGIQSDALLVSINLLPNILIPR